MKQLLIISLLGAAIILLLKTPTTTINYYEGIENGC